MRTAADLSSIRAVFNEKEKELSVAAAQVEELTRQLEQFSLQAHHAQAHPGSKAYFVQLHLERLRAELMVRISYVALCNTNSSLSNLFNGILYFHLNISCQLKMIETLFVLFLMSLIELCFKVNFYLENQVK